MNTATVLHRTAMEYYDLASIYKAKGQIDSFDDYRQRAWLLEKEAALKMLSEEKEFTFKYLVIRSAAILGKDMGHFAEAKELLELALLQKPSTAEKYQMEELLTEITQQVTPVAQMEKGSFLTVLGTLTAADIENRQIKIRENGQPNLRSIAVSADMIKRVIRFYLGELVSIQLDENAVGEYAIRNISKAA